MEQVHIEQAKMLKAQGRSLRSIAAELNVSLTALFRALKDAGSAQPEAAPSTEKLLSVRLAERIEDARAQFSEITEELEAITRKRETLLSAETLDTAALLGLDQEHAQLTLERQHLEARLPILANQKAHAETQEAQGRLNTIPSEAQALVDAYPAVLAKLEAAQETLLAQNQALADVCLAHRELMLESQYLRERYEGVTEPPSPMLPPLAEVQRGLDWMLERLRDAYTQLVSGSMRSQWERKLHRWREYRK